MYKLLYVDDEELMRDCIFDAVKWEDYNILPVGVAENGVDALEIAIVEKPDIVVTDIMMPHMDGLELVKELRRILPGTRIIILSGYNDFSYAQKAIEYKVTSYILKPFVPQKLIDAVMGAVIEIENEHGRNHSSQDILTVNNSFNLPIEKITELKSVIQLGFTGNLTEVIDGIFDEIVKNNLEFLPAAKLVAYSVFNFVRRIQEDMEVNRDKISEMMTGFNNSIKSSSAINEIKVTLGNYLREMVSLLEYSNSGKDKLAIEQSRNMILGEYMKEDLCLNTIADYVHLSPGYLRQLFKKATGESLNNYLTSIRIKHAHELLVSTEKKLHEIALEVGYKDEFYLSNVFKKYYGLRPSDVRTRRIERADRVVRVLI